MLLTTVSSSCTGGKTSDFLAFARVHFMSAQLGHGIGAVMKSVDAAYAAAMSKLPTPKLTRALQAAVMQQQPPRSGYSRPKLRYAHQGGSNPPRIIVHGTGLDHVPDTYRRYLERFFREALGSLGCAASGGNASVPGGNSSVDKASNGL